MRAASSEETCVRIQSRQKRLVRFRLSDVPLYVRLMAEQQLVNASPSAITMHAFLMAPPSSSS